jgi:hypothetical protein
MQTEAEAKVDRLCELAEQTLQENEILRRRLMADEHSIAGASSSRDLESWSIHDGPEHLIDLVRIIGEGIHDFDAPVPNGQFMRPTTKLEGFSRIRKSIRYFAFEDLLAKSWVYRRAASNNRDTSSIGSGTTHTASWSMLSGVSLSKISDISILELPIYSGDVKNNMAYHFGAPESSDEEEAVALQVVGQLGIIRTLSPRPSIRLRVRETHELKLGLDPLARASDFVARTSLNASSAWLRKPIGDLADELDSTGIHELMERDQRSREPADESMIQDSKATLGSTEHHTTLVNDREDKDDGEAL